MKYMDITNDTFLAHNLTSSVQIPSFFSGYIKMASILYRYNKHPE